MAFAGDARRGEHGGPQHGAGRIAQLDPQDDVGEIYRILVAHEFPGDMNQALTFALFRTYAVPSIGSLQHRTGEFTEQTQKRYEDTGLLLDAVVGHGVDSPLGKSAVRRVNLMHSTYAISNDDMRSWAGTWPSATSRRRGRSSRRGWTPTNSPRSATTPARAVAEATLARLGDLPPDDTLPSAVVRRMSFALMDEPQLGTFPRGCPAGRSDSA